MDSPPPDSLLAIVDRLAKLEGLIIGLQTTIAQGQNHSASFISKVERLEERQLELERHMVTKTDLASIGAKVDQLITSEASRQGSTAANHWTISSLAQWLALVLSLLALIGVGIEKNASNDDNPPQIEQTR
jgi:hypothetical protein